MLITSADNARVKLWASLNQKKYRDQHGLFIVEETHMIEEAIRADVLDTLIIREGTVNPFETEAVTVTDKIMRKLSSHVSLNDCIAVCRYLPVDHKGGKSFIILEDVQDPGNVGTIIRTAYSFGYDAVYLTEGCASPYNEKTLQSTQGAIFHIPVISASWDQILKEMRENEVRLLATALKDSHPLKATVKPQRYALVFGNEGRGLKPETVRQCDESIRIEMDYFESLNVASAMAIASYYLRYMI